MTHPQYDYISPIPFFTKQWAGLNPVDIKLETDAEWYVDKSKKNGNIFICITFRRWGCEKQYFLEHPDWEYYNGTSYMNSWRGKTPLPEIVGASEVIPTDITQVQGKFIVEQNIFYSEGDIRAFWGDDLSIPILKSLRRDRILRMISTGIRPQPIRLNYWLMINGVIRQVEVKIIDHSGYKSGGLKDAALKSGIVMPSKTKMDDYKSHMNIPYSDNYLRPEFIKYAIGDCILYELNQKHKQMVNKICDVLEIEHPMKYKKTKGATVADTVLRFIDDRCDLSEEHLAALEVKTPKQYLYAPIAGLLHESSIEYLIEAEPKFTTRYNAVTMGGRIKNEQPHKPRIEDLVVSMDLKSCYGTALMHMYFPIGLPSILENKRESPEKWMTLETFLKKYEFEFVPDCWMAVIDTLDERFTFNQNIFFSKSLPIKEMNKNNFFEDAEEQSPNDFDSMGKYKGEFNIQLRAITSGILTHHSLQTVRAVATNAEWSEFKKKVRIKTAIFYRKSQMCKTIEEFKEKILLEQDELELYFSETYGASREDRRSRAWYPLPLKEIVQPLKEERDNLKAKLKHLPNDSYEYLQADAQQQDIKEFVNTIYGVIACPYFPISNPVVSNNITDQARMACWAMATCSGGLTSITDGSEACLNTFKMWKKKLPGINTLALINRDWLIPVHTIEKIHQKYPLGGKEWSFKGESETEYIDGNPFKNFVLYHGDEKVTGRTGNWAAIDKLYRQHIKQFFDPQDKKHLDWLERFDYEAKDVYKGMSIHSQSDYRVIKLDDRERTLARGYTQADKCFLGEPSPNTPTLKTTPITKILEQIYNQLPIEPSPTYFTEAPYKVNAWRNDLTSPDAINISKGLLPGDTITKRHHTKAISHSMFYYQDFKQKEQWMRRKQKLDEQYGWGLEGDYVDENGYFDYDEAVRDIQDRIDNGKPPKGNEKPVKTKNPRWKSPNSIPQ